MTDPAMLHAAAGAGEPPSSSSLSTSFFLAFLHFSYPPASSHLPASSLHSSFSPSPPLSYHRPHPNLVFSRSTALCPSTRSPVKCRASWYSASPRFVFNFAWVAARMSRGLLRVLSAWARFWLCLEGERLLGAGCGAGFAWHLPVPCYLLLPVSCRQGRAGQLFPSLTHTFFFSSPTLHPVSSPKCLPAS